jgi:hypothetical protein
MERTITDGTNTQRPFLPRIQLPRPQRYGPLAYRNYSGDRLNPANPTYTKHNHTQCTQENTLNSNHIASTQSFPEFYRGRLSDLLVLDELLEGGGGLNSQGTICK